MNFYPFHIGDYISHTSHLTDAEDLAYRRLIDLYYLNEVPFEPDLASIARKIKSSSDVVDVILNEFFVFEDGKWHNKRADIEIAKYQYVKESGKKGAEKRWANREEKVIQCDTNAPPIATPIATKTINQDQEPLPNIKPISMSESKIPTCPQEKILFLWKKHLPHLTQPRSWEGTRQQTLKQRWIQASKKSSYSDGYGTLDDGVGWWNDFFEYISKGTKLANGFENNGRVWKPTLEWILKLENFQKIIDGKYNK